MLFEDFNAPRCLITYDQPTPLLSNTAHRKNPITPTHDCRGQPIIPRSVSSYCWPQRPLKLPGQPETIRTRHESPSWGSFVGLAAGARSPSLSDDTPEIQESGRLSTTYNHGCPYTFLGYVDILSFYFVGSPSSFLEASFHYVFQSLNFFIHHYQTVGIGNLNESWVVSVTNTLTVCH